jgi:hypothetical protein
MSSDTKPHKGKGTKKMVMTDEEDWVMEEDFHGWIPIQIITAVGRKRRVGSS